MDKIQRIITLEEMELKRVVFTGSGEGHKIREVLLPHTTLKVF